LRISAYKHRSRDHSNRFTIGHFLLVVFWHA